MTWPELPSFSSLVETLGGLASIGWLLLTVGALSVVVARLATRAARSGRRTPRDTIVILGATGQVRSDDAGRSGAAPGKPRDRCRPRRS